MVDDYLINYLINEARRIASSPHIVGHKRVFTLYLSADRVERLRRLLYEKMPGMSLSSFIDMLIEASIQALGNSLNSPSELQETKPRCDFITCGHAEAVGFAINKTTGKRYPVCQKHYEELAHHEKWIVEKIVE